jgi:hypothetical protein
MGKLVGSGEYWIGKLTDLVGAACAPFAFRQPPSALGFVLISLSLITGDQPRQINNNEWDATNSIIFYFQTYGFEKPLNEAKEVGRRQ